MKQIKTAIVTLDESHQEVLKKIIEHAKIGKKIDFFLASGMSSAISKINTIYSLTDKYHYERVLLVTDITRVSQFSETREPYESILCCLRMPSSYIKLCIIKPDFSLLLLNNKEFLAKFSRIKRTKEFMDIAKFVPQEALKVLVKNNDILKRPQMYITPKCIMSEFLKDKWIKDLLKSIK